MVRARIMPIYEYECGACAERHEFIQKFSDAPKRKCPACGAIKLKRLVSAAAFHLKGTGWYVTDFRDKDKKKGGDSDAKGSAKGSSTDNAKSSTEKTTEKATKSSDSGKKSSDKKSAG